MKTFKAIVLLTLIFVAGFAGGVVVTRAWARHVITAVAAHPDLLRLRIERELIWRLRLDPQQRKQVHEILADSHEQLRALRQQFQPQFSSILHDTHAKIDAILTPEQRERFDRLEQQTRPWLQP